jgi:hypothetical protein
MKFISFIKLSLACEAAFLALPNLAKAQNANYAPGDLILYFQKEGASNTVYANVGNAATLFRGAAAGPDAANRVNFLNINAKLVAAFGAAWASDATIYTGLAGVWGTSNTSTALQNGDPSRTLYISAARTAVGAVGAANSAGYTVNTNTGMTTGASGITQQNNVLEVSYTTAVEVSPTGVSFIDDQNPFLYTATQGTAFGIFGGGVQQVGTAGTFGSFGAAGTVVFALDLYRILALTSVSGQVGGVLREGSYEGTVTINSSGSVSFIAQPVIVATPFETWAATFPALDTAAKRLPSADPDVDGMNNLMEFVLNGNPGSADSLTVAPTLNTSGSNFVFSFKRKDGAKSTTSLSFEYGGNLSTWTSAAIATSSSTSGNASISVSESGDPDVISVSIPKSEAADGKLFGRLKVTSP